MDRGRRKSGSKVIVSMRQQESMNDRAKTMSSLPPIFGGVSIVNPTVNNLIRIMKFGGSIYAAVRAAGNKGLGRRSGQFKYILLASV